MTMILHLYPLNDTYLEIDIVGTVEDEVTMMKLDIIIKYDIVAHAQVLTSTVLETIDYAVHTMRRAIVDAGRTVAYQR